MRKSSVFCCSLLQNLLRFCRKRAAIATIFVAEKTNSGNGGGRKIAILPPISLYTIAGKDCLTAEFFIHNRPRIQPWQGRRKGCLSAEFGQDKRSTLLYSANTMSRPSAVTVCVLRSHWTVNSQKSRIRNMYFLHVARKEGQYAKHLRPEHKNP